MKSASLFAGYLGLDLALQQVFNTELAWVSEIDPGACKIIAHHMDAPNLGDITKIDFTKTERIHVLTTGWPCQPFSIAGKRKGADDERALWPEVARAVRILRPRYVVLENVAAIATGRAGELARVTADLSTLGYVGSWLRLRASDVGAPHGRARMFIVAQPADATDLGLQWQRATRQRWAGPADSSGTPVVLLGTPRASEWKGSGPVGSKSHRHMLERDYLSAQVLSLLPTPKASEAEHAGRRRLAHSGQKGLAEACNLLPTPSVADVTGGRKSRSGVRSDELLLNGIAAADRFGQYAAAIARWEPVIGRPAPDPAIDGRLSPLFVEWLMGLPAGWVTDVPGLSRAQQLKALGNGVVPQQAAAALSHMINTMERAA